MPTDLPTNYQSPSSMPASPPPPPPRRVANNCLVAGMAGCGVLVIVLVIVGSLGLKSLEKNKSVQNFSAGPQMRDDLVTVRDALKRYTKEHNGTYPATLNALAPKYLADAAALTFKKSDGQTEKLQYFPPSAETPPDEPVASYHVSDFNLLQEQRIYLRLLKDGRIVRDQVIRSERTGLE